ncbi:DUF481 domain-containing protein [Facilibium subflavum]|uniref:DUF481 domain-containing protein n=1 Tax=Facilibium subflavum TaxID=2219058 RepID=UPI000E6477EB|nr:DUF481 domain-containing protein [Facilibium subflavum]
MNNKLLKAVTLALMLTGYAYAITPQEAQKLADKYHDLAKTYEAIAQKYEKQAKSADKQTSPDSSMANTSDTTLPNEDKTQKTAQRIKPLSPWAQTDKTDTQETPSKSEDKKSADSEVGIEKTSHAGLPESIINDQTVKTKQPNIAVAEPWKGTSFGLGGSMTTGNSASTNYNGNANLSYTPIIPWQNTLTMNYLYSRDDRDNGDGVKTNKFNAFAKTSWNFDKNNGIYFSVNYLNNQLDTYSYILTESLGYLRQLYSNDNMTLSVSTGPSLTQQKVKQTGEFSNAVGWQSGLDYVWNFTDSSSFKQSFLVNYAGDNGTTYQSNSSLSTQLYKNLALQFSFQVNGSSWASSGKKRVGTTTTTSLVYNF